MKLKGWGNRAYNIFFHLHTVSGIVISVALYIIFFAGAFTLFKPEFYLWENPATRKAVPGKVDPEKILAKMAASVEGFDLDDDTFITFPTASNPVISIYGHVKPASGEGEIHYAGKMDPATLDVSEEAASTIGETLYRLHFLDQIPYLGRWIAGFVSLFFVFASITGLLVHWKNMMTKFWAFSFKGAWKQVWTNSHTVFGLLGLPFQLMYAVTGAFYLLLLLVLMPAVIVLYDGKPEKVYALAYPNYGVEYREDAAASDHRGRLEALYRKAEREYGDKFDFLGIQTHHLLKEDGAVSFRLVSKDKTVFSSHGYVGYRLGDGSELFSSIPGKDKRFSHMIIEAIMHLHFATFGGLLLKGVYFLLSLFTCFVIIGGILIWKEARNNKNYTARQKKFHHRVTILFLAVCFGLFPATAILFGAELAVKGGAGHITQVNTVFFVSWLLLSVAGILLGSERKLTWFYLLTGGISALLVPLVNGWATGDWFWKTPLAQVRGTDIFWLATGALSLFLLAFFKKPQPEAGEKEGEPIPQYRNAEL